MSPKPRYIRYQSTLANARGSHPGIFGLANVLGRDGKLTAEQHAIWRAGNDWYNAAYPNPSDAVPDVYDHRINPGAAAWFKDSAHHLLERVEPYLRLLDAHQVPWERLESADPGRIIYEDEVQVVVVPAAS